MAEKPNSMYRKIPSGAEDVGRNTVRDVEKLGKTLSSRSTGAASDALMEAGSRAATRLVGRAGAAGAALDAGWEAGRAIDKATGVGKRIVDSVLGEAKADGDRVELSAYAKSHDGKAKSAPKQPTHPESRRTGTTGEWGGAWKDSGGVREGSNENISDDVRERARKYTDEN